MGKNPPSLKLRQNASQSQAPLKKDYRNKETQKKINSNSQLQKKSEHDVGNLMYPGGDTAFKALLSARFCAAIWSHITDCDETYNYWEPTHYIIFGKGLQTWEYSPEFALRSYAYIVLHVAPAYLYHMILQPNPMLVFYFLRCVFGLICAYCELTFYKAVCREFGVHVGRLCLLFQIFSPGMFISSTAYLPSSWAMYGFTSACAAWWEQKYPLAIFCTGVGSLLGWPFSALLGVPIAFDMFKRKLYKDFVQWSALTAFILLPFILITDFNHYGKFVVAPWNIVKYNVLAGPGSELYGTEPFSYYIINGFLNFNIVWVLTLLTPVALVAAYLFVPTKRKSTLSLPHIVSLSPLFLWLGVFLIQPHKEERFLYPIYPMVCLCGAVTIDILQKLWFRLLNVLKNARFKQLTISEGSHYLDYGKFIMVGAVLLSTLMGLSRTFALYKNYHAPLDLMMELNRFSTDGKLNQHNTINVCFAKDWHRSPSSFFLPNTNWSMRFVQSEFKGILPAPYSEEPNGTMIIHKHFNNLNREEPSLYTDINKCHFLLDLDLGRESDLEPIYAKQTDKWVVLKSLPFLNAEQSSPFFRSFYIPFISDKYVQFGSFSLLHNSKLGKVT